jgi:hypothetical protein
MDRKSRIHSQKGNGKTGCFFATLLLASLAYLGFKFVPPLFSNYQLQDAVNDLATFGLVGAGHKNQENPSTELQNAVLKKAEELDVPLTKENVKVLMSDGRVDITVTYTIPIELPGYVYNWDFEISGKHRL